MLHWIIGTAGTGKTTRLLEQLQRAVEQGETAILLVPEQLSFESEKRLYRALGPRLSLRVEVLSFTRLCNSIFRALGGLAERPVTTAGKYLLMSLAVGELQDTLQVYRKSAENTAFLQTLVDTCTEFKTAGVRPEVLSAAADDCDGLLQKKLVDLSALYSAYQTLLEQGYADTDDDLIRACALLELHDYFAPYTVFVDGFTTFMTAEFELLGHVLRQAKQLTLAMTCDQSKDMQGGMGVYSPVQEAMRRLGRMAEQSGVPVAEPEYCPTPLRYRSPALRHISRAFLQPGAVALPDADPAVQLYAAADRYAEIDYVAASIARLVREEGVRYRDIAVVARETGPYLRAVEAAFAPYDIPWFAGQPRDAENHPLVAGLLHAVDAVRSNFHAESMLLLAKSPLLGLDLAAAAKLENYCYCWGVRGAVWEQDFVANPRGLAGPLTEFDQTELAAINRARAALAEPLLALRATLQTGSAKAFATGLFRFLEQVGAAEHLTAYAEKLPTDEQLEFLNESAQVWDMVMDILDVFGSVLGETSLRRTRLCDLLRMALGTTEVALPPQTLDQVLVGKADRIRPAELQAVFVIGAVEGEFPAQTGLGGVFSDEERRQMLEVGIEIAAPSLGQAVLEKFFAYDAVTLPARFLTVSYPRTDFSGQELLPSVIVSQLQTLLPGLVPAQPDATLYLAGEKSAFGRLAREFGRGTELEATLLAYFSGGERQRTLSRMEQAHRRPPYRIVDRGLARELFGGEMRLSPTRVERYFRCPFSFFAADGLAIRQRQKVEFSPLESGSVIHNVLQVMVQRHGGEGLLALSDKQLREEVEAVIAAYLSERVEDVEKLPLRFRHLFTRLTGMLARLLRRIGREFAQSAFTPAAFELPISTADGGVPPLRLQTADGVQVMVEGVVDRVDIMEKNGERYVRVVDYKSGAKDFSLADVLYGINMQMLLYLFTIQEHATGSLAGAIPAGVLYMPVRERFITADRDTPDKSIAEKREKQWRMSGLLLEDEEILRSMEQDLAGIFIPARMGKKGLDAKSSLAGKAEMGRLSRKVQQLVLAMAEALGEGEIGALPTNSADFEPCNYCDYRPVCGFEPGDPAREIAKLDRAQVLQQLEKEMDDDGA